MAQITLKGNPIHTNGELPAKGTKAPSSALTGADLADVKLSSLPGTTVLNIFPSVDTPVCATSVRKFNELAGSMNGVTVVNVSADLPFAQKRFCGAEGLEGVVTMSTFRSDFAKTFGIEIVDGPLAGLCARAVLVIGADQTVRHAELVPEIAQEPNYDAALSAARG